MKLLVKDNVLYESILAAIYDNKLYAAPVGFTKSRDLIRVKVYRGTRLYEVVSNCSRVALNFTHDPLVFLTLAFKEEFNVDERTLNEMFTVENGIPILRTCIGYMVVEKLGSNQLEDHVLVEYREVYTDICSNSFVEPFTRCYAQLIEAAIHASRVKFVESSDIRLKSIEKLASSAEVIRKTCSIDYIEMLRKLEVLTEKWLRE